MGTASRKPRPPASPPEAAGASAGLAVTSSVELDRRRVVRALRGRKRYRYVHPVVLAEAAGFRVLSPCCSRNIDATGGTIDIARLEFDAAGGSWCLYSKDHAQGGWIVRAQGRLHEMLDLLNRDPERIFWQ
jgi:hypothetical protein